MSSNPALELAFNYVAHTDRHVFLTGKAGTGKTTFLHRVKKEVHKRMCVVAPTGVAAINAGAQTIHSQFSLPFGFLEPGLNPHRARQMSKRKSQVLQNIDLLIIDEISMVRADILDAIDTVLRKQRRKNIPFGGVQLLMIGDLHQLPPVVVRDEEPLLKRYYATPYFFAARVMKQADAIGIPLTHIYRQSDATFIDLLNKVRNNQLDAAVIDQLNSRFRQEPDDAAGQITLTSHNATAKRVNERNLGKLTTPGHHFEAEIKGTYPKNLYPNDLELNFKVGAQVMFNKNDTEGSLYYNGKIGEITDIADGVITVKCPNEKAIEVHPVTWENNQIVVDEQSGAPKEVCVGEFIQHPLRLAWAITIHKSQGLTFDRVIIDAGNSFSHGQVYVALSRCRTFEGITLRSKISHGSVLTDSIVTQHAAAAERNCPTEADLREDRRQFQITCLEHLFDFTGVEHQFNQVSRALTAQSVNIQGDGVDRFLSIKQEAGQKLISISKSFQPQIRQYRQSGVTPETDAAVQTRLRAAATYYLNYLRGDFGKRLTAYDFLCDNRSDRSDIEGALEQLWESLFIKTKLLEMAGKGFTAELYSRTQTLAQAEYKRSKLSSVSPVIAPPRQSTPSGVAHGELFQQLMSWRLQRANEVDVQPYRILSNQVIINLCQLLPVTREALLTVKGIGQKKTNSYGEEVLNLIRRYTLDNKINGTRSGAKHHLKAVKTNTFKETLDLFRQGLSASEIAERRGLQEETVYVHAIKFLRSGALTLDAMLGTERRRQIETYTQGKSLMDISVLHHQARGKYSLGELRAVLTARTLLGKVG
ncbi:HRDC domain-containing protein [Lewinella sp. 4G2]|uniref:HRDC domain-containing protein n=1 Tax=Lewinella sp. 4G2 TaxID=1803372 RepID=UPI0007B4713E|nr:HRDC domain-containing protein [Lewinella sp. 4G2]OAV43937.1 hypothetical protein A3850_005265 [Lewinella sp. 4G2]